ncbi:MAG: alkyl hydroperoxide reductase, partial [Chloroflexi bacterium]|nr:alkyl hydroperoxide reductase [Chloroflexota bacterium]
GLFDFGDRDGIGEQALMQHVQGVAWHNGTLYLADTYNHRVKRLDPTTREVTRWLGNGQYGLANGPALQASFHEPGGLTALNGALYVADTNNHALRAADFRTGTVRTLDFRGL